MENQDFTTSITVDKSPAEVFDAILNVRGWWSGLYGESFEGSSEKVGDEFSFLAGGGMHYSKQKLVELEQDKKLVWLVTESNLTFLENTNEWQGTRISFELFPEGEKTKVVFTHVGLIPEFECYNSCAPAWTGYVQDQRLNLG
ncbi:SRPBCC family protein [Dyadobacter fanqingshengii]|uniref:SRPBCC domain-containing protein n=1 Tax=Dyadobacter fanqingshengii TaxID=2906443 RepID=A0A9X1TA37_9BACT|nr:SRPBCC domain-containing protein [Dyadobacter fanqingshengii]MCF0041316.1 SRPBCC domain-containing protein [Dyadobacter fanqingshengii]MCF2505578.1 SRPBCC domain-containing protein [Dyadobacter fanqingshengii]USJ36961.1 SRPBCC domain-containing protein [Dyadobacter fanqingshengii]